MPTSGRPEESERAAAMSDLVERAIPVQRALKRLARYRWDLDHELVVLQRTHVLAALDAVDSGALSRRGLEEWADAVYLRDDVGYEPDARDDLIEFLHIASTPEINGEVDMNEWRRRLS
jgi:hypothetical protein